MPMEKTLLEVQNTQSKKEKICFISFECHPDADDKNCSKSVGMFLLMLEAIPAPLAVQMSSFTKRK